MSLSPRNELLPPRLPFLASAAVAKRLAEIGRTEDLRLSPDGRTLAITAFNHAAILLLQLTHQLSASGPRIKAERGAYLTSPALGHPHGLAWLDEQTLLVADRATGVVALEVPKLDEAVSGHVLQPLLWLRPGTERELKTCGSLAVRRVDAAHHDLLVCNNNSDRVSRHLLRRGQGLEQIASCGLLAKGLRTPDGVSIAESEPFIAISNHEQRRIDVFENGPDSGPHQHPIACLQVLCYPHAVRFMAGDRRLLVADAGAPFVHFFAADDRWRGKHSLALSLRVLDDPIFWQVRGNPREGGPKGLELLANENILAITCEQEPLAFFEIGSCLPQSAAQGQRQEIAAVSIDDLLQNVKRNLAREPGALLVLLRKSVTRLRKSLAWRANKLLWRFTFRAQKGERT